MKTKRALLIVLAIILIFALALVVLVACDKSGKPNSVINEHEHTFSPEWLGDEKYHWQVANCEHTDVIGNKAEHTFGSDGKCSVCNSYGAQGVKYIYISNYGDDYAHVYGYGETVASDVVILDYYGGEPVTSIDRSAFKNCENLKSITIPNSVTSIDYDAFSGCSNLQTVTFDSDSQLQSIGSQAFSGCGNLTEIAIPNSVTNIGYRPFDGCNLENVYYDGSIADWCKISLDYDFKRGVDHLYFKQDGEWQEVTEIEVPEGITAIGDYQFYGFDNITSISLPNTITSIGRNAFEDCANLKEIIIPDSVTSIGYSAFEGCSSLTEITVPSSVTSIGYSAFHGCSKLQSITLPFVGENAEGTGETNLGCIFGVSSGFDIVSSVPSLSKVFVTGGKSIGFAAFYGCSKLTEITIPSTVTSIDDYAFTGSGLTEITIPSGVTTIGRYAFQNMQNLHLVYWNATNCTIASSGIFDGSCNMWNSARWNGMTVIIGNNVEYINDYTFYGADIGTLVFEEDSSLKEIGQRAFSSCNTLREVRNFPSDVKLADNAFSGSTTMTSKLSSFDPGNLFSWNDFLFYKDGGRYVLVDYVADYIDVLLELPDAVYQNGTKLADYYSIGDQAFIYRKDCVIAIPTCVTSAPDAAFSGCTGNIVKLAKDERIQEQDGIVYKIAADNSAEIVGAYIANDSITILDGIESLTLSSTVKSKYIYFNPISITIPNSITNISGNIFDVCKILENVYYDGTIVDWYKISFGTSGSNPMYYANHFYMQNDDEWQEVTEIIIPKDVTTIGNYQFYGFGNVTSISLPNTITSIGIGAFASCANLIEITIPSSVTSIGDEIFYHCSNLQTVIFDDSQLQSIGSSAFEGCTNLKEIIIPDSVTAIGSKAFYDCSNLQTMAFGSESHLQSIGNSAFRKCGSLQEITIPSGVTSIGTSVFYGCYSLQTVTFDGDSQLQSIGGSAFQDCDKLANVYYGGTIADWCKISFVNSDSNPICYANQFCLQNDGEWQEVTEIEIPEGVTAIGNYQFYDFDNITSISLPNTITSIGICAFARCANLTEITIPDSVTAIGSKAFVHCYNLQTVIFDDDSQLQSIGSSAFEDCNNLKEIIIPDSVTAIGSLAFYNCYNLQTVTFENSNGWTAGNNSPDLSNPTQNAIYFRDTYCGYIWRRSE